MAESQEQSVELTELATETEPPILDKDQFKGVVDGTKTRLAGVSERRVVQREELMSSEETKKKTKDLNKKRKEGTIQVDPPVIQFIQYITCSVAQIEAPTEPSPPAYQIDQ